MNQGILDLIVRRYVEQTTAIGSAALAAPATDEEIDSVRRRAKSELGADLDPAYLHLATLADGIGADGYRVFSTVVRRVLDPGADWERRTEALVEENLMWREEYGADSPLREWVIYGIGERDFILQDLPSRRFQLRSRIAPDHVIRDRDSFELILWEAFRYPFKLDDYTSGAE